jgi:hypothetical protein
MNHMEASTQEHVVYQWKIKIKVMNIK